MEPGSEVGGRLGGEDAVWRGGTAVAGGVEGRGGRVAAGGGLVCMLSCGFEIMGGPKMLDSIVGLGSLAGLRSAVGKGRSATTAEEGLGCKSTGRGSADCSNEDRW